AVVPAARISDLVGRKKVIYAGCAIGAVGLAIVALAPALPLVYAGVAIYGVSAGIFLAVDWALMTDIIPKASSGRYMGISNVATASSGVVAIAFGGQLTDLVNRLAGYGAGPRAADLLGVACFALAALLLRPVDERRREDVPVGPEVSAPVGAAEAVATGRRDVAWDLGPWRDRSR